jgi:hypothetical protein
MPQSFLKPFNYSTDLLIMPHPTIREYVPFLGFAEVDPEYKLYPYKRERIEAKDEVSTRFERQGGTKAF